MTISNYHTHTEYCDGKGKIEDYILEAIKNKMPAIGFTGHAPVPFDSWWNMSKEDFEKYISEIDFLKKKYSNKIEIYIGLEADYIDGISKPDNFKKYNLDFIIGSIHYLFPEKADKPWDFIISPKVFAEGLENFFDNDINLFLKEYYCQVNKLITENNIDIFAHIDQVHKFNLGNKYFSENTLFYKNLVSETLNLISEKDIIIEINTRGKLKKLTENFYPSDRFIRMCKEQNVRITLSADAHKPIEINSFLEEAKQKVKQIGYKEIYQFRNNKWIALKI